MNHEFFYRFLSSLLRYIFPNLLKLAFFSSCSFTFNWCQKISPSIVPFFQHIKIYMWLSKNLYRASVLPRPCPPHILFPMAAAVPSSTLSPSSGPVSVSLPCAAPSLAMPLSPFPARFRLFSLSQYYYAVVCPLHCDKSKSTVQCTVECFFVSKKGERFVSAEDKNPIHIVLKLK